MSTIGTNNETEIIKQYHRAINQAESDLNYEKKRIKEERNKEIQALETQQQKLLTQKEKESAQFANQLRENQAESLERKSDSYQSGIDQLKQQIYNQKGQISNSVSLREHEAQLEHLMAEAQIRGEFNAKKEKGQLNEHEHQVNHITDQARDKISGLIDDQAKEITQYSKELAHQSTYNKELEHRSAEALTRTKSELYENSKAENRNLEAAYNGNLSALKKDIAQKDQHYQDMNQTMMSKKLEQFSTQMQAEKQENHHSLKDMAQGYDSQIKQLEKTIKDNETKAGNLLENKSKKINEDNQISLQNQSKTYDEMIDRLQKDDKEKISSLQGELVKQKTSTDTGTLSPGLEAAVRKQFTEEFEKKLALELDRNKNNHEEMREKFTTEHTRLLEDYAGKETLLRQENALDKSNDRLEYFGSLQEVDQLTKAKLREDQHSHTKETGTLLRQFGQAMERQRKDYDHILQTIKADSDSKLTTSQKESEIRSNNLYRTLTLKQNELIREYEDKLSIQKEEYESQIENLKTQSMLEVRETEKKARQELDVQTKSFEQRLAHMESQTKERENSLNQSYQTEIDKVRRNYELNHQKKS